MTSDFITGALVGGIFTITGTLVGGIFSGVIAPILTARLRERERRLELYKILYPLRVEAGRKINESSIALMEGFIDYLHYIRRKKPEEPLSIDMFDKVTRQGDDLELTAMDGRWIVGDEVVDLAMKLSNGCLDYVKEVNHQDIAAPGSVDPDIRNNPEFAQLTQYHQNLSDALQEVIHLSTLDDPFGTKKRRIARRKPN